MRGLLEIDFYKNNLSRHKVSNLKKVSTDAMLSEIDGETVFFALVKGDDSMSKALDQAAKKIEHI
jgi:hypothetical protein